MSNRLSYDLDQRMLETISEEFAAVKIVSEFKENLDKKGQNQIESCAEEIFGHYGVQWMKRTLELGEYYSDATFETLKKAISKTGFMFFPLVPQRFVEIAYLSVMSFLALPVVQNNSDRLIYKLTACDIYENVERQCGNSIASSLPCRYACLTALRVLFETLDINVTISMEAVMSKDGYCQFCAAKK